ncbi:ParB/RepB/Spo0J family partition protein [Azohydromonas aeria]|uniref:ParB/RepB/Spo0J family partition protein n=1 Tax=Azohydromonas aeria TaxID=2590212 RepID=UPI0012F95030|nr:ParB/RepB/Spo0J family partition protein [Azohydromonas aeria]
MSFKHLKASLASAAATAPTPAPASGTPEFIGGTAPSKALLSGAVKRVEDAEARAAALQAELDRRAPVEVALSLIDSVPGRRRRLTAEAYAELRENLRANPLVHPIAVRRKPDGRFEVVSGENRLQAYRDMGRPAIAVTVLELPEEQVNRAAFFANLITQELSDYERWQGFQREQELTGLSQAELARLAGISDQLVSDLFAFARLPKAALEEIRAHPQRIGVKLVKELARLSGGELDGQVTEAVRQVIRGELKQQQAVAFVRARPRAPKPAASAKRILAGRFKFAERRVVGSSVRVDFATDGVDMAKVVERIDALLQEMAAEALKDAARS